MVCRFSISFPTYNLSLNELHNTLNAFHTGSDFVEKLFATILSKADDTMVTFRAMFQNIVAKVCFFLELNYYNLTAITNELL